MKLKKLDIIGFKSFIDKVTLTFPDGITAIVGPNGSGKSNLMDAIKWALGEQSAKSLRGKSMEDIIFNGSREKKPLGMAEVTLTFGNIDGNLSHSFSHYNEITVRRRIYRSGESEYFLNKTPCRLKDITDLFLGTGVGSKTYSMIAQGQIGDIITARPLDRRTIIEEAAGITKYKAKKLESQRKMEATQNNLVRIGDIIGEVKRQMDSLSQQAKKAEEYKGLKSEIKRLELITAAKQFVSFCSEIDRINAVIGQKEREETVLSTRFSVLEGTIEQEKTAALEKEEAFSEVQKSFYANETDIKTLEQQIDHLKDRILMTENQNGVFTRDIEALSRLIGDTEVRIEGIGAEIEGCQQDARSHGQELEIVEDKIDALTAVIDELSLTWESLRESQTAEASRIAGLHNTITSSEKWIERSEEGIAKKTRETASLTEELARVERALSQAAAEKEKTNSQRDQAATAVSKVQDDLSRLREEEARLAKEHQEAEADVTKASLRKRSLEEMEKNFEGLTEGTKSVMSGDREGVLGILADFIESDERHERALEGYLGEMISAVVVRDPKDAKNHIDRLKTSQAGRAVFISVSESGRQTGRPSVDADGVMGRLHEFVTVKGPNSDIFSALLGGACLTADLGRAIEIWKQHRPEVALVTLEGEVLTRDGIIFGGGGLKQQFSLLKNKREKKTLDTELSKIERGLTEKAARLQETRSRLAVQQKEEKETEQQLTALTIRASEVEKELVSHERDHERLLKTLAVITSEIERDGAEIERLKAEYEESMTLLTEAEKGEGELKIRSESLKSSLADRRQEMRLLEDRQTEIKLSLNTAQDNARHLLASVEEHRRQIERAQRDIENKHAAAASGTGEIEQYTQKIGETEKSLYSAIEQSKRTEDLIRDARAQLDAAVIRQRELDEERKQLAKLLSSVREDIQTERDRVKESLWEKENLVTRIQERHHEDLNEVYTGHLSDEISDEELTSRLESTKRKIDRFGEVNLMALSEYNTLAERYEFLKTQQSDLVTSLDSLNSTIKRIDKKSRERFMAAFQEIDGKFREVFARLLPGGRARLILTDEEDPLESGVDILAQPPGKRLSSITLLSGGEKALTTISLIFAIFIVKPTPFCMMDEMDAPLDDVNTERIIDLLKEISFSSQVILITHNKRTMEMADTLYGITMEEPGVSKTVSVKLTS